MVDFDRIPLENFIALSSIPHSCGDSILIYQMVVWWLAMVRVETHNDTSSVKLVAFEIVG